MGKMHCKKPRWVGVRRIKTLSITFSLVMLEFFVRMIYNNCYSVCACSSVDRAPASGAGCVGSIPVRRTKSTSLHCGEVLFCRAQIIFRAQKLRRGEAPPCSKAFFGAQPKKHPCSNGAGAFAAYSTRGLSYYNMYIVGADNSPSVREKHRRYNPHFIYIAPPRRQASASYFPRCGSPAGTVRGRKACRSAPSIR